MKKFLTWLVVLAVLVGGAWWLYGKNQQQAPEMPTLQAYSHSELGQYLADTGGFTLYIKAGDSQTESTCYGQCAVNWPPLLLTDQITVGEGVDAAKLGTLERTTGETQVTYGGKPLYYWVNDAVPGDATGHGFLDGEWSVARP